MHHRSAWNSDARIGDSEDLIVFKPFYIRGEKLTDIMANACGLMGIYERVYRNPQC